MEAFPVLLDLCVQTCLLVSVVRSDNTKTTSLTSRLELDMSVNMYFL